MPFSCVPTRGEIHRGKAQSGPLNCCSRKLFWDRPLPLLHCKFLLMCLYFQPNGCSLSRLAIWLAPAHLVRACFLVYRWSLLCVLTGEKGWGVSRASYKGSNPIYWGLHPHDLIPPQRSYLLISSPLGRGQDFNTRIWGWYIQSIAALSNQLEDPMHQMFVKEWLWSQNI